MSEDIPVKKVSDSFTTQVQILNLGHLNGSVRLFGGQLMSWMDVVAAVAARRHSGHDVVTARMESLNFISPAYAGDTLILQANVAYVGSSSMYVKVETFVEKLNGSRQMTNQAWFVMVALDENEKPTRVPGLEVETPQQQADWEYAKALKMWADQERKKK